jgi:glycosyltransferase involved in cell wall biosynthesis
VVSIETRSRRRRPESGTDSQFDADLSVRIESDLPTTIDRGAAQALFVCGTCFHRRKEIRDLRIGVPGEEVPPAAMGMPRPDLFEALHPFIDPVRHPRGATDPQSDEDPELRSYRSGFWAIVPLSAARTNDVVEIHVVGRLADGSKSRTRVTRLDAAPPEPSPVAWEPAGAGAPVAICMATFNPPQDLLESQIETIRAQSHSNWICCISDDHSARDRFRGLEAAVAGDERFRISRSERRLGHYDNFERALRMAPREAEYVALCDQDDRWRPEKLEVLLAEIGDARLVYSDARLVDAGGEVISETYWSRRRNRHSSLASLLIANTVTGAASLARRDLLDFALPFPPRLGRPYHDHWLAICALVTGRVAYVDRPLYDYVQHAGAHLGHAVANAGAPRGLAAMKRRLRRVISRPRQTYANWRAIYFYDVCRVSLFAATAALRAGSGIPHRKRRVLEWAASWSRSPAAIFGLSARRLRRFAGRNETLGSEGALARGLAWRWTVGPIAGHRPPLPSLRGESRMPDLNEFMGRLRSAGPPAGPLSAKTRPLDIAVRPDAPVRVNVLLPTIDLRHFFGGYLAKLNLARRLAERGRRVRVVTVDPAAPLPRDWKQRVESYAGLENLFGSVEVAFGRENPPLEVNPNDSFVATTWWTAHIAAAALRDLRAGSFLYLIQEYEPFTFPMGSFAAAARESYGFAHSALFSSELLREWFSTQRIGVFAEGAEGDSVSFQNAITPVTAPSADELDRRTQRSVLFYARPEEHAARNMFETGLAALQETAGAGLLGGWRAVGIGSVSEQDAIELGRGLRLEMSPRLDQSAYAELLPRHDVGLALMYTPHPSLVPIEMASAGLVTVTNTFENKTAQALEAISPNLVASPPTPQGVAEALAAAISRAGEGTERVRGAEEVAWSRNWDEALDDALMDRVEEMIDGG